MIVVEYQGHNLLAALQGTPRYVHLAWCEYQGHNLFAAWVGMWCAEKHDEWFGTSDLASHPGSVVWEYHLDSRPGNPYGKITHLCRV